MEEWKRSVRCGVNMRKYCLEHENWLSQQLEQGAEPEELLRCHERKIRWLQHERLIHLLVTILTAVLLLFVILLYFAVDAGLPGLLLLAIVTVLLAFYIRHYFFLENTVQHWYVLFDEIDSGAKNKKSQ